MRKFRYCPHCRRLLLRGIIEERVRSYCSKCGFIHYINPIPSVAMIVENNGRYLLIKRGIEPGKGTWAPPSGFIEADETMEEACIRELREETGFDGVVKRLLDIYYEKSKIHGDVLVIAYLVDIVGGSLKPGDDAIDAKFFEYDNLPEIHFNSFRKALKMTFEI